MRARFRRWELFFERSMSAEIRSASRQLVHGLRHWIAAAPGRYALSARGRTDPQLATMVLIISADAVAAALLGALIETLGYSVRFARPPESAEQTIRRVRPTVCLLDCEDPANCSDEFLGRATMRGISVIVFGKRDALDHVRALALAHEIDVLVVPPDPATVDDTLRRAIKKAG
jgi:CheY-like chemotaxis protein